MDNVRKNLSLTLGKRNTSILAVGAQGQLIEISYLFGGTFVITGYALTYDNGQEKVLVTIKNNEENYEFISGETELCTVGRRNDQTATLPFIKLAKPIRLKSGQSIQAFFNNLSGAQIDINDLCLTLDGYTE
jgi:hypothetical protein